MHKATNTGKGRTLSCCCHPSESNCVYGSFIKSTLALRCSGTCPPSPEHCILSRSGLEQGTLHFSAQYSRDWATAALPGNMISHWHSSKASDQSHTGCSCSVTWRHQLSDVTFLTFQPENQQLGAEALWVALMLMLWTFFSRSFLDRVGGPLSVLWCHLPKLEPCSLPGVFLYSQVCWLVKLVYSTMLKV